MYCLYKNSNVLWQGRSFDAALTSLLGNTLSPDAKRNPEEMAKFEVYRLELMPKSPAGKINTKTGNHALSGFIVRETFTTANDPNYVEPDHLANAKAGYINQIKREAGRRIVAIIPEWKQRNLTARAAILAAAGSANWTVDEQAEWDAGIALWAQVDALRSKSDVLEVSIGTMTQDQLWELDILADETWA